MREKITYEYITKLSYYNLLYFIFIYIVRKKYKQHDIYISPDFVINICTYHIQTNVEESKGHFVKE